MATHTKPPNSGEDYISNLPDDVIIHILSYVPTDHAVATTVLSKRWNRVWTSVPNLDFDSHANPTTLADFVDRVLTCNNVLSVRAIRLHHYEHHETSRPRVNAWISSIAERDAEVVDLMISTCPANEPIYYLPDNFFTNKNLVELKISVLSSKIPQRVCFPNLVTIRLDCFRFDDEDSMKNLLLGCPVLRNLYIFFSTCVSSHTYDICSSTLHVLHVGMTSLRHSYACYNFVLDTPSLRDLDFVHYNKGRLDILHVSALVKLNLEGRVYGGMYDKILSSSHIFHSLIHLKIHVNKIKQWESVARLLQLTPNLVTFGIALSFFGPVWCDPVPRCLSSCIESVDISFCCSEPRQEEEVISYILENANVLKKLSIHTWNSGHSPLEENDDIKRLLSLPRSSRCQVYYQDRYYN